MRFLFNNYILISCHFLTEYFTRDVCMIEEKFRRFLSSIDNVILLKISHKETLLLEIEKHMFIRAGNLAKSISHKLR